MDFLIFSTTDMQYKAIQAPAPSLYAYPFSLLMEVTHNTSIFFAKFLGLDSVFHS